MSFGDFFKKTNDLTGKKCFSFDNSLKIKTKTAEGASLETNVSKGKMKFTVKKKFGTVNVKKFVAATDGHFDVETEFNDSLAGATIGINSSVGSNAWQGKNNESFVVTGEYAQVDNLNIGFELDLLGKPNTTLALDACYGIGDTGLSLGVGSTLNLPFCIAAKKAEGAASPAFSMSDTSVGLKYSSSDFEFGVNLEDPKAARKVTINGFHQASSDTKWGFTLGGADLSKGLHTGPLSGKAVIQYALDGSTTATLGLSKDLNLEAKYEQTVSPSCKMTYQGSFNLDKKTQDGSFGVGIELSA